MVKTSGVSPVADQLAGVTAGKRKKTLIIEDPCGSPPLSQPTPFDLDQAKGKPKWRPIVRGVRMDVPRYHPEVHLRARTENLWVFAPPLNHAAPDSSSTRADNFRFCLQCVDGFVKVRGALLHDLMGEILANKGRSKLPGISGLRRVEAAPTEEVKETHATSEAVEVPADAKVLASKSKAHRSGVEDLEDDDLGAASLEELLSGAFTTRDIEL